ncbi:MAG: GntR family transcriptional regulator [Candidatus Omnitrophota bacterium]
MAINKFQKIADLIEKRVENGVYPPGIKLPSERSLAKKYHLSHMTVNKAVASLVGRKILKRLYGNGTYAIKPKKLFSKTIGIALEIGETNQHSPFTNILPFFQEKGYLTTVFNILNTDSLKKNMAKFLAEKPVALIVDGSSLFPFEILNKLRAETRLIFIHRFEGPKKIIASYILSDYRKGGYLSAKYLLDSGRKKVLIISFPILPGNIADIFYQGCEQSFQEAGIRTLNYLISKKTSEQTYEKIFSNSNHPDGILSFGDFRVIPALEVMKRLKIKVPQDVSVIGYHNTLWSHSYNFTSVSIREDLIVKKAWEVLQTKEEKEILVEPVLTIRNTLSE